MRFIVFAIVALTTVGLGARQTYIGGGGLSDMTLSLSTVDGKDVKEGDVIDGAFLFEFTSIGPRNLPADLRSTGTLTRFASCRSWS